MTAALPRRGVLGAGLALALGAHHIHAQEGPSALERIRARGRLLVAVYNDLPPFHQAGKGIEVDLAQGLARELGVGVTRLTFTADENMGDDLRNMVWKGHVLGYGPADVLLHVPVDAPLMQANPRVSIFAPYWRERVVIARDLARVPQLDGLAPLKGLPVAVPGQSLAGWLMIGAEGGALRDQLITRLDNGVDAARLLQRGEVAAACGLRSELESALRGDPRYAITPLPMPRAPRDGWAVGMAVKRDAPDLAQALQTGLDNLVRSGELPAAFTRAGLQWQRV